MKIGEWSVVVTIDFANKRNETANLEDRLSNGTIFDPIMVSSNTSAYRVMEAQPPRFLH